MGRELLIALLMLTEQALIVATGIGYYFAKGENEKRWKDQRARGLRSPEHQDCEWTCSLGWLCPPCPLRD